MTTLAYCLLALAAVAWCIGPLVFHLFEQSQSMDPNESLAELEARINEHFAAPEAIANRMHAQAVNDGLIWDGTERRAYRPLRKSA